MQMDYEALVRLDGWKLKTFERTKKWVNPVRNDGAAYCDSERAFRYICEDYGLGVK